MATPFEIAHRLVDDVVEIDPLFATSLGLPGHDHLWPDLSEDGVARRADLAARYRAELSVHSGHADPTQRLAVRVLDAALGEWTAEYAHGDHFDDLRHMASTFQHLSLIFTLMDTSTESAWDDICTRLETIDQAFAGYRSLLEAGRSLGHTVAARQVHSVIEQAATLGGDDSAFNLLVVRARGVGRDAVVARLESAVAHARAEARRFGSYLERTYLPDARAEDGVGEERYQRAANRFVGRDVDLVEAYAWGWEELAALSVDAEKVAAEITFGGGMAEAKELLENDPDRAASSPDEFVAFIRDRQNAALAELSGVHFDVAPQIAEVTVNLSPPGGPLGAYYLTPSEDFTRAGGVWYSLGDQSVIPLYHHVSTAYHEGFPGHHLQMGTAMVNEDRVSRAHRLMVWYPGFSEGWALYAERLMHELGFFERPDYVFGMLAKHLYRATRVVVDIGLHLGLAIPDTAPLGAGERWSFGRATEYLEVYGFRTPAQAVNEALRYLGWPGQAIAYKLGEREILSIRAEARRKEGDVFDLKSFHSRVIGNGSLRLDLLREVVLPG